MVTYFQQAALFSCTPGMRIQAGIKFVCFPPPFYLSVALCYVLFQFTHIWPMFISPGFEQQSSSVEPLNQNAVVQMWPLNTQKKRASLIELGNWPLFTTEMTLSTAGFDTSVQLISVRNSLKRGRKTWQAALFQLLCNCRLLSCT